MLSVFPYQGMLWSFNFLSRTYRNVDFQTVEQFEFDGCDNCESFLRMKKNKDRVMDVTSNNFDG